MKPPQPLGQLGEKLAKKYLQNKGYVILRTHYTCHWGEIDIIAQKNQTIVFVEVKTRSSDIKGEPHEAITYWKLKHLARPIQFYLLQNKLFRYKLSLDVISVSLGRSGNLIKINHFENIDVPYEHFY